ncbi:MAG: alpha/beta hydrolase [Planctomycetes bacterium]|nr:alpha/beta hydrolase [Planctomycetota bacterium]
MPILFATLVLTLATALGLALLRFVRFGLGRPGPGWRTVVLVLALAVPVHALLSSPVLFGWLGSRFVGTRGDERDYAGPRLADDGSWLAQSRETLRDEREGDDSVDRVVAQAARDRAVHVPSSDGVVVRAFVVPAVLAGPPRATAVLVHGLFRGALEIETPGRMFRELGCEVILVEMRNHGGSTRAPATFGLRESDDVVAVAEWARARGPECAARPLVLYGVSLGSAAVALAAPRIEGLAGLVLDAPMDTAAATAARMLGGAGSPSGAGRHLRFPEPLRSLALAALEFFSDVSLDEVRPIDALCGVPPELPVLIIGAGIDDRMPPAVVRDVFDALPTLADRKQLWIAPDAEHGRVFDADPLGYRDHLAWLLGQIRRS